MSFLETMRENREKSRQFAAQQGQQQKDEALASMQNPNSNVDEVGKVIGLVILPAFALWVWYIGYIYVQKQLDGVVDPEMVTALAFAIPAAVQFIKLYSAKKVLRAWHFKWYDHSAADFWLWSLMACVVGLMFVWSLKISIFDVRETAQDKYITRDSVTLSQYLTQQTGSIDAQIAAINSENSDAGAMRTKSGKIAWTGQSIKEKNSTTLLSLQNQKSEITKQAIEDYRAGKLKTQAEGESRGNFFRRFGGFGEAGEILFLLIMGLIEGRNRRDNIERLKQENSLQSKQAVTTAPAFSQNSTRTPIGFKTGTQIDAMSPNTDTVSQNQETVSQVMFQGGVIGSDTALKHYRTVIIRDLPNLDRKDAKQETVVARIEAALNDLLNMMQTDGWNPSEAGATTFYDFLLSRVIPTLDRVGAEYPNQKQLVSKLFETIRVQTVL